MAVVDRVRWTLGFTKRYGPNWGLQKSGQNLLPKTSVPLPSIFRALHAHLWPSTNSAPTAESKDKRKLRPTLYETSQNLTPSLQKRMSDHDLQEALQALPPVLDDIVTKAIREDLARQGWDCHTRALPLEDVAEVFEVRIAPAHAAVAELEGGDVGAAYDLVVCVHVAAHSVGARVFDLKDC